MKDIFKSYRYSDYLTAGLRIYSNRLAWRYDPYHSCTNFCTYCFARFLERGSLNRMGLKYDPTILRMSNVNKIAKRFERIFIQRTMNVHDFIDWCVVRKFFPEVGTMAENFMEIDRKYKAMWNFMQLLKTYGLPLYTTTKGNLLIKDEKYYNLILDLKKNGLIVDVSLISHKDDLLKKLEPNAPLASERVKLLERLVQDGVNTTVSARPFIQGTSDVDFDDYIKTLCETGTKSIHLRKLYLTGYILTSQYWKDHVKKYKEHFDRYGVGWRTTTDYIMPFFNRAMEIAKDYDCTITGSNTLFFELEGASNKMDYNRLDDEAKKHLFPYSVIPMLKKIKEKANEPQILYYDERLAPILEVEDKMLDAQIHMDAYSQTLVDCYCAQTKPRVRALIPLRTILKKSMWNGWHEQWAHIKPYLPGIKRIRVLTEDGKYIKDEKGNLVYFYNPEDAKCENKREMEVKELEKFGLSIKR